MSRIAQYYDEKAWKEAGNLALDRKVLDDRFQRGLLHLVYWVNYVEDGRKFMHENMPMPATSTTPAVTEDDVRKALTKRFKDDFGVQGPPSDAMIAAHLAGAAWVVAHKAGKFDERGVHEASFNHFMAAVAWHLWEEGTGALFPLPW